MVVEGNNTNTLVLLMIAGGLYYFTQSKESKDTKEDDAPSMMAPLTVALLVTYSLRKEIQESGSPDRWYAALAIVVSNYIISIDGSFLQASGAALTALIILPAIQHQTDAK